MKIALVGYGKMGQVVEKHALNRGEEVVACIDPVLKTYKEDLLNIDFDVIIEFSHPDVALDNLRFYAKNDFKVVMATTGWWDHLEEVKLMYSYSTGAVLWSGNFSLGVNLVYQMLEYSAKLFNHFPEYDVLASEFHHKHKADSPSGTLLSIGKILLENLDRKTTPQVNTLSSRPILDHELHLTSTRGGQIPGTHLVMFDSEFDTIEIKHTARTRDGFAVGSLVCAQWLMDKQGYFEISDFTRSLIKQL